MKQQGDQMGGSTHEQPHADDSHAGEDRRALDVADADDSKRIVRVGGAVAPSTEVGHTYGGHGA